MAESRALCTRMESTLQDTVKEQDRSFTVTTLGDPSWPAPFLSVAKEARRRESDLVSALARQRLMTVSYSLKFSVIISCLEMPCVPIILILVRINPSEVAVAPQKPLPCLWGHCTASVCVGPRTGLHNKRGTCHA